MVEDALFLKTPVEWYHGQATSSAHDTNSIQPYDLPWSYVLVCYPRDGTPVCNAELIDLQQKLDHFPEKMEVIVASTDSPETHTRFFNDAEAFDPKIVPNITYPVLTIREYLLTGAGKKILLNEFGYCKRVAVVIHKGLVKAVYETDNDVQRDIDLLINLTKSVIKESSND